MSKGPVTGLPSPPEAQSTSRSRSCSFFLDKSHIQMLPPPLLPPSSPQISQSIQWRSVIQLTGKASPLLRSSQRVKTQESRQPSSRSQKQRPVMDGMRSIVFFSALHLRLTVSALLCIQTQKVSKKIRDAPEMMMNPSQMNRDPKETSEDADAASDMLRSRRIQT